MAAIKWTPGQEYGYFNGLPTGSAPIKRNSYCCQLMNSVLARWRGVAGAVTRTAMATLSAQINILNEIDSDKDKDSKRSQLKDIAAQAHVMR